MPVMLKWITEKRIINIHVGNRAYAIQEIREKKASVAIMYQAQKLQNKKTQLYLKYIS